jgi:hypothetical protein
MPGRALFTRCLILALSLAGLTLAQTKVLRCPDLHGDKVACTCGGAAVRLTPDIEVENDRVSMPAGRDHHLERGVPEVPKRMVEQPMTLPRRPADPVKTK